MTGYLLAEVVQARIQDLRTEAARERQGALALAARRDSAASASSPRGGVIRRALGLW